MNNMNNSNNASIESNVDEFVNELIETSTQTLNERINGNTVDLRNYLKHDGGSGSAKTGSALLLNKISNLSVIDFDINKDYDEEQKARVRNGILSRLSHEDLIVKTGSGGLHVYVNQDLFFASSNRMIKCYSCNDFDVDLMCSVDEDKRSLVVLPGSKVRKNARSQIYKYEFVQGGFDSVITRSLNDVLNDLDIKIKTKQSPDIEKIINENENEKINDELAEAIIYGLEDLEIHNDAGCMPITREITLFTLFQAINSLPYKYIDQAYETVYECCNLTDKAKTNFENARARYSIYHTSPFVLIKILKLYRSEYFEQEIKPLLTANEIVIHKIDFKEDFTMQNIRAKAENGLYTDFKSIVEDLSKVIRFIDNGTPTFIQKIKNVHAKTFSIQYLNNKDMNKSLKMIKLFKNKEGKYETAYSAFERHASKFAISGVKFVSDEADIFSTFQGLKYKVNEEVNEKLINPFLNLIYEVICVSDNEIYEYVLNWISNMIQNPGVKNETALVLKGLQGIGKNTFTDVICEILAGYSENNVTEMNELTGNFNSVVEDKMLIVLNELKNHGEERMANFNALKSIITDKTIRINEKNQPRRTSENVANFIFCTNNAYPVKIEAGDRRYVVLTASEKYKNNFDYWNEIYALLKKPEFYDSLTTYFIKRDISEFNPRKIPMTEAKQDLIDASRSPIDVWICNHYNQLLEGINCSDALLTKPSEMKDKQFQMQIKERCERRQIKRKWHYILKEGCKSLYKQTENEFDDDYDDEDLPVKETI